MQCFYSKEDPLQSDIVVRVEDLGCNVTSHHALPMQSACRTFGHSVCLSCLQLRFEPVTQRLRLIDVYNVPRLSMTYNKVHFAGPDIVSTFVKVYDVRQPLFHPPISNDAQQHVRLTSPPPSVHTHTHSCSAPRSQARSKRGYALYHSAPPTLPAPPTTADWQHWVCVLQVYFLHYRGVTFTFLIPKEYHSLYANSNDMPLELPVRHTSPVSAKHAT